MSSTAFAYDLVTYPSHPLPQTHPSRLAAIGTMLGMSPAPVEHCRVLELGGGDGSNLIPLALVYPESQFVGIDLAETAVAKGNAIVRELALKNVDLRAADLLHLPQDLGAFDFIIAHGLFSWVPEVVRDKVLAICREHLRPQGIAYISYNALPGCHIRRMMSDMMRHHVRGIDEPGQKVAEALALVQFLAEGKAGDKDPYAHLIHEEMRWLAEEKDRSVLYHDDLAEINQPFFFHEFMKLAAAHDLQFLAEADFFESTDRLSPPGVAAFLQKVSERDPLEREQYLDFLKCRRFRQTLLVHKEVPLKRDGGAERISLLSISSRAKPEPAAPSLERGVKVRFRDASGASLSIDLPLAKSAFLHLGVSYPLPIPFNDLVKIANSQLPLPSSTADVDALANILTVAFSIGLIELHSGPATFARHPSEKPQSSPLARLQIQQGQTLVTSLRHSAIQVENALSRQLISLLDGTRDRQALLDGLVTWALAHPAPGQPAPKEDELRRILADQIEPGLQSVAAMALLYA